MARNMRRNIEVTNSQEDHVREVVEITVSRGPVFYNFDNTIKTFTDGISQISIRESDNVIEVMSQRTDKLSQ